MELLNMQEYFSTWDEKHLNKLSDEEKERIYNRHKLRKTVFDRDAYVCQNSECNSTDELTMHHLKHQRNGGDDKPRNCVTLCHECHEVFNRGGAITYKDNEALPSHIRGRTYQLHKGVEKEKSPFMNRYTGWARKNRKEFRNQVRDQRPQPVSWQQIVVLLMWVFNTR